MTGSAPLERQGCWAGLAGLTLIFAGFFAIDEGGTATADAAVSELVSEIADHRGRIVAGSLVGMVGALLVVWFAAALRVRIARRGGAGTVLAPAAAAFGTVVCVGALVHGSYRLACATVDSRAALGAAMPGLAILNGHITDVLAWGVIGMVATLCAATFACRILPVTMAYVGGFLAVATVALVPTDHGGVGISLLVWLAVAAGLVAADRADTAVTAAGTGP
jgi:hypothetical protein